MYRPLTGVPGSGEPGLVYLLHFERPYKHARHYWGWALKVETRNAHHKAGTGANLMAYVAAAGISWEIALVIPGDKHTERRMKNRGGAARLCPLCKEARGLSGQSDFPRGTAGYHPDLLADDAGAEAPVLRSA